VILHWAPHNLTYFPHAFQERVRGARTPSDPLEERCEAAMMAWGPSSYVGPF